MRQLLMLLRICVVASTLRAGSTEELFSAVAAGRLETIRDLLAHRSGLNRTDLAMVSGVFNREELIKVAGLAKPTAKLGEKFQYQNQRKFSVYRRNKEYHRFFIFREKYLPQRCGQGILWLRRQQV